MSEYIVSIPSDITDLENGNIFNYQIAQNFPGALWAYYFKKRLEGSSVIVNTADIILKMVKANKIDPKKVYVISHNFDYASCCLVALGCQGVLCFNLESPLYSQVFFKDKKMRNFHGFRYVISFGDNWPNTKNKFCFPSYDSELSRLSTFNSDIRKKRASFVVSNKHVPFFYKTNVPLYWRIYEKIWLYKTFKSFAWSVTELGQSLQIERLEIIDYFMSLEMIDVYGRGWDRPINHPKRILPRSMRKKTKMYFEEINDKLGTISNYEYNFCVENFKMDGYVTEKIIDSFVAGCIPLYCGPGDAIDYIDKNSFINISCFGSFKELALYITSMSKEEKKHILSAGQEFLNSTDNGFSFQRFSENIHNVILNYRSEVLKS